MKLVPPAVTTHAAETVNTVLEMPRRETPHGRRIRTKQETKDGPLPYPPEVEFDEETFKLLSQLPGDVPDVAYPEDDDL
jgi:hypothetical protein